MNNKEKKNKYNREIYKNNKEEFKKDNRWVRRTRRGTYRTRLNNPSVVGAMNNLFRYQAIQVEDLEDVYYQIQDGKVKWLVKFPLVTKPLKSNKTSKGKLDTDDMLTMKLRMKECKSKEELYDKYYQQYTTASFLKILKLAVEDIKKDRR